MHEKLRILFEKINLDEKYFSFFENGKIKKLVINKEKNTYHFILELESVIPYKLYELLLKSLQDGFNDLNEVNLSFNITKDVDIKSVYIDLIKSLSKRSLLDNEVYFKNDLIVIEVINSSEKLKLEKFIDKLGSRFSDLGVNNKFDIVINEEQRNNVLNEINNDKNSVVKKSVKKAESNVVFGNDIKVKKNNDVRNIIAEDNNVIVEAYVFDIEGFESSKSDFKIVTLKINDLTDSMYCKIFTKNKDEFDNLMSSIKVDDWYKIQGYVKNDTYSNDLVLNVRSINKISSKFVVKEDLSSIKRVELHAHTFMSQMDGLVHVSDLIKRANFYGHKSVAITDHSSVQAFPDAYKTFKKLNMKGIYGVELNVVDDQIDIVIGDSTLPLDSTYVVFDVETTGFNATSGDELIEIGAVKLKDGKIIDKFSSLIKPKKKIPKKITEITNITNEMVKDCDSESSVINLFKSFIGDLPLVAHNAKFDISFIEVAFLNNNLGSFSNVVIDTMQLSRILDSSEFRHNLTVVAKRYGIEFSEDFHHRADYDAEVTALVFAKMLDKVKARSIDKISDINKLVTREDVLKFGNVYHITVLAQNNIGIKNLYQLVSLANTKYLNKTPRILKSKLVKYREGLLYGSCCANGEVFVRAKSLSDEELLNLMRFYDFIEVQPLSNYDYLVQLNEFSSSAELLDHVKKIVNVANNNDLVVVATSDSHHLDYEDKIYREIFINQKIPGGGLHYLNKKDIVNIPSFYFRTTDEMLSEFSFLDSALCSKIVIDNSNKIFDLIENVEIIKNEEEPYTPKIENSANDTTEMVYSRAKSIYGSVLPKVVSDRIEEELNSIITHGFDVIYLISQKLVKKSNDDGYLVGSRGSVGSSFAATMMGITEVNPLPAHYVCPNCKSSIFDSELSSKYSTGYDLPDLKCSCGTMYKKEGQDMPFATFLGFKGDKVPDIDLNFSSEYQSRAHDYTKELFGADFVFRAGTIGTVADKTAFGFVKGYAEDKNKSIRKAEVERLAKKCVGVKRTTGQHPGGIVVIPNYMSVFDFTPYQYPADDSKSSWYTTHFDFSAIHDYILKLDILGHDDPTVLKLLLDATGINIDDIPFTDSKVLSLFSSPDALGVSKEDIECEVGTLGVPEFGTNFVIDMLKDVKPKTFSDLVKVSGLSHGTDVWLNNAKDLIEKKVIEFNEVIACRDDIMIYLMHNNLDSLDAFKIMEFVRKGNASYKKEEWDNFKKIMESKSIPDWYIDSCSKIKYMFPKAHATAYVMMALRIAYFKVYYPINYYSAYFSVRTSDYDINSMIKGYDSIKDRIYDIRNKGYEITNKETAILEVLKVALEMVSRGYKFSNIDLYKSDSHLFVVDEANKSLIPPFRTIDGLGEVVASNIVEERSKSKFFSIEDLQNRAKLSVTVINRLRIMGVLDNMPETSQLSLF